MDYNIYYNKMRLKRKLINIGDSVGVVINKSILEMLNLRAGDWVEFTGIKKYYKTKSKTHKKLKGGKNKNGR